MININDANLLVPCRKSILSSYYLPLILITLKPISDMFPNVLTLDYVLTGMLPFILILALRNRIRLYGVDFLLLLHALLVTISLMYDISAASIFMYIKIMSHYILYFIGRLYGARLTQVYKPLRISLLIVLLVNLVSLLTKSGMLTWGAASTFSGIYFFKFDLSTAMCQLIILWEITAKQKEKNMKRVILLLAALMVLLSNSRAYYLIIFMLLLVFIRRRREIKLNERFVLKFRHLILAVLIIFVGIIAVSQLMRLNFFKDLNFLTFETQDFFGTVNTQGRNGIWQYLFNKFREYPIIRQLFGIDLSSDRYAIWYGASFDSHSNYLKVLFNSGFVGLGLYFFFFLSAIRRINGSNDRSSFYLALCFTIVYLLGGLSASTIVFTQQTWLLMLFLGMAVSTSGKYPSKIT